MNEEEKERKLLSLMAVRRSGEFWSDQRERIQAGPLAGGYRAWLLAPAAAAAAIFLLLVRPQVTAPPAEQQVSLAMLENLDLLDDLDVLEAIPEDKL